VPKVSVYVPDELWDKVKALAPESGGSQLIQETIREYVDRRERKPYAVLNDDLVAMRNATQERAQAKVGETYREGYEIGLELADELPWELLCQFARLDWDFQAFDDLTVERNTQETNALAANSDTLYEIWANIEVRHDLIGVGWPIGPHYEGVVDALKDIWEPMSNAQAPQRPDPLMPAPGATELATDNEQEPEREAVVLPFRQGAPGA
jgi:hypothetical protein